MDDLHLHLSLEEAETLVHGVMGMLPKCPTDEVALTVDQGITDSPRTVCKILSPLPELCKGRCVRFLQGTQKSFIFTPYFML